MDDLWQVGVVVDDLAAATEDLSQALGLTWAFQKREIDVVHEGVEKTLTINIAISHQGPVHLEIIQAQEGSPWWPAHGFDHIAHWTDRLVAKALHLELEGWTRQLSYQSPDGAPLGFSYHRSPGGFRAENVDAARRDGMMNWLQGGEYPAVGR